ncbi:MAG TPA: hypothetical protein VGG28_14755 [Kofleriaceae bacterium]|jgi:hypothetical protein
MTLSSSPSGLTPAAEVRDLGIKADGAARAGDHVTARRAFIEAAVCAQSHGMWRSATRCYRRALELDVGDRELVGRIATIAGKLGGDWLDYSRALDAHDWPSFSCRTAQIVVGDLGGVVTCPNVGAVLEVMMGRDDHVDAQPDGRFAGMPFAMAMLVLRRALWPSPRELANDPMSIGVTFAAGRRVRLDEHGEWQAAT